MTPDEFADKVRYILEARIAGHDEEYTHSQTDDLMEEVLYGLGYTAGVTLIRESTRWYA
jgi:hypothetical protein